MSEQRGPHQPDDDGIDAEDVVELFAGEGPVEDPGDVEDEDEGTSSPAPDRTHRLPRSEAPGR